MSLVLDSQGECFGGFKLYRYVYVHVCRAPFVLDTQSEEMGSFQKQSGFHDVLMSICLDCIVFC